MSQSPSASKSPRTKPTDPPTPAIGMLSTRTQPVAGSNRRMNCWIVIGTVVVTKYTSSGRASPTRSSAVSEFADDVGAVGNGYVHDVGSNRPKPVPR
jgi:hypothetical protein